MPITDAKERTSSALRTPLGAPQTADAGAAPPAVGGAAGAVDPGAAWAAVLARDATQDGRFVYAVRTTGVYCRPSCPSRRPRRENVAVFADARGAATAGFRACRRCRPEAAEAPASAAALAVGRARAYLDAHADEAVSLDRLARHVGASPTHLQRTFTRLVGASPKRYAAALRADRLRAELKAGATVSRAAFEAGFGAASRAYDAAAAHLGMTPAAYRRGGRGVPIRYATAATAVGRVLVAATPRGVCAVTLGDDDAALEAALAAEYPHAARTRVAGAALVADADLRAWLASAIAAAGGPAGEGARAEDGARAGVPVAEVPTDVPGTPFQDRVWRALRAIPAGETRSYAEVATAIGAPRAVRAVASAVASNRVALLVPCHRVVPTDARRHRSKPRDASGSPAQAATQAPEPATGAAGPSTGQYRWGADRKRALLAHERRVVA